MKFLIDSMLPPSLVELLDALGHDCTSPSMLGAHNLPDDVLVRLARADDRVIVTENASDFAAVTDCTVLFVRKSWWPAGSLASNAGFGARPLGEGEPGTRTMVALASRQPSLDGHRPPTRRRPGRCRPARAGGACKPT